MARGFGGRTLHSVSAYLLGDTLIDSGCPATADELTDFCRRRGVRRIVHTHHHEDHTGGDAALVAQLGLEVWAPPRTVPILASFYRLPWYRRLVWGTARQRRRATVRDHREGRPIDRPSDFHARPRGGPCLSVGARTSLVVQRRSVHPHQGDARPEIGGCRHHPGVASQRGQARSEARDLLARGLRRGCPSALDGGSRTGKSSRSGRHRWPVGGHPRARSGGGCSVVREP